jgi:hypothetical protein
MDTERLITHPWTRHILYFSFAFYLWYLASTLLLPLTPYLNLPEWLFITLYKLADFPLSILGFIICVSLVSSIIVLLEFKEKRGFSKFLLIEGVSFVFYFIIPIVATLFLLVLVSLKLTGNIPTEIGISHFLEDLFLFTSALFLLTAILNVAMQKFLQVSPKKAKA